MAVGTTVVRTLESAVDAEGKLCPLRVYRSLIRLGTRFVWSMASLLIFICLVRRCLLWFTPSAGAGVCAVGLATAIETRTGFIPMQCDDPSAAIEPSSGGRMSSSPWFHPH